MQIAVAMLNGISEPMRYQFVGHCDATQCSNGIDDASGELPRRLYFDGASRTHGRGNSKHQQAI